MASFRKDRTVIVGLVALAFGTVAMTVTALQDPPSMLGVYVGWANLLLLAVLLAYLILRKIRGG